MTLLLLILQAASSPPSIEIGVLLRWLIVPGVVVTCLGFLALASFDRFLARRIRTKESNAAALFREVMGAKEQRRETATWIIDLLADRHEDTKGFIARIFASELRERAALMQLATSAKEMADANQDAIQGLRQGLLQQGESLRVLPQLQETFVRVERTMTALQSTMQTMEREMRDRLARMEGIMESQQWDGAERRDRERRDRTLGGQ